MSASCKRDFSKPTHVKTTDHNDPRMFGAFDASIYRGNHGQKRRKGLCDRRIKKKKKLPLDNRLVAELCYCFL